MLFRSVRVQRFGPSGGTIVPGMQVSLSAASLGRTFTFRIVGSTITLTGTGNTGGQFTLTGTDTDITTAGGVGVDMGATSGGQIDNLVVTAR